MVRTDQNRYTTDPNSIYSASTLPTSAQPAVTYLAFNPNDFYWNTVATAEFPTEDEAKASATALVEDISRLENNKSLSQKAIQMQTKQTGNDEMYENMMDIYNTEIVKVINMSAGIAGILAYLYYYM